MSDDPDDPCDGIGGIECARMWTALIEREQCSHYLPLCRGIRQSQEVCDLWHPEAGGALTLIDEETRLAVEEGRIRFDEEGARCIREGLLRCETVIACPPVWVATTPHVEGDRCRTTAECGDEMFCRDGWARTCGSLGTCTLAHEGEWCRGDTPRGFACASHRWVRASRIDETAMAGEPCNSPIVEPSGEIVLHGCGPRLRCGDGGVCEPVALCGGVECAPDEICIFEECAPPSALDGAACFGGPLHGCPVWTSSFWCDYGLDTCERTDRRLGALCSPEGLSCVEGVCRFDHEGPLLPVFRCGPPGGAGDACRVDSECASHACCGDVCR